MKLVQKFLAINIDVRVLVGLIGLLLSVLLHELFHVIMHWGHIVGVGLFTNPATIVEIVVSVPKGYSTDFEELIAYTITVLTMLVTVIIICKIHDAKDTRTFNQIIFPKNSEMHHLSTTEVMKLTHIDF